MINQTNDFSKISKDELVRSMLVTINNLYDILENSTSEKESKKVSGCLYLLETALYGKSSQNPFLEI